MSRLARALFDRFYTHAFIGSAAAVVGIAAGLNSMGAFGGGHNSAPDPKNYMYYNPEQQGQAAGSWMDAFTKQSGLESQLSGAVSPQLLKLLQGGMNTQNPALSGLPPQLQGAYGNIGSADQLYAQMLGRHGSDALSTLPQAGMSTYLRSLDPNNALHDQMLHGVMERSGAGQAARGIQIGGMGQGMSDEAGTNFEMDWSNQLLGRQVQGLSALEKAYGTAGQTGTNMLDASANMWGQVPGALSGGAGADFAPGLMQSDFLSTLLGRLGGGMQQFGINPLAQVQNQAIPFLNQGAGAGANAFSGGLNAFNANTGIGATGMESLLTGMKGLSTSNLGSWLNSMGHGSGGANSDAYSNMAAAGGGGGGGNAWSMSG